MDTDDESTRTFVAITSGDVSAVAELIAADPGLARRRLRGPARGRTPLQVVTDWPGFYPNGPEIARMLIEAGADLEARRRDGTGETPLQWAASSDDADVARVLIDAGADINAANGSIGTVLDNAVGYACWNVARLLVERGATVSNLWTAAALGLSDRLRELLASPATTPDMINQAFWHACAGGQRRAAELLRDHGADLAFVPVYGRGSVRDLASDPGTQRRNLIEWLDQLA